MESIVKNSDGTITIDGEIYEKRKVSQPTVFAELCKNLTCKEDREKYPDSVFWLDKDGKFMFEHDEKNGIFWCSYDRVWSVFESKFGMKYDEIQALTKGMVEEHFKCKGVTTRRL